MTDQASTTTAAPGDNEGIRAQLAAARSTQGQEPAQQEPADQGSAQQSGSQEPPKPPWGDDFDAERAWSLVQGLRNDKASRDARIAALEASEAERQRADMTELDRTKAELQDANRTIESMRLESLRNQVAIAK